MKPLVVLTGPISEFKDEIIAIRDAAYQAGYEAGYEQGQEDGC